MPQDSITIEGARLVFRNFAGKEGKYNREGDRNFCVLLESELANRLAAEGWNVKSLRGREEGDPEQPYLMVAVGYGKGRPPRVVMVTSKGKTTLSEDEVEVLDWVDIKTVDLIVRPYNWSVRDASGVKAYLRSIYIVIEEDALELKYADLQDLNQLPARAGRTDDFIEGEVVDEVLAIER